MAMFRRAQTMLFLAALLVLAGAGGLRAYEVDDHHEVSGRKPVNISAFQLLFDRLKGLTLFKGNVKAIHGHVTLTSDEMRALSENREATAEGKVKVVDPTAALTMTCGNLEYEDMMNLMTAHDHPLLTSLDENGRPITVLGRQMELDSEKKTVVIHQNVQIIHDDGKAEAQKATYLSQEDKFILEEDPQMTVPNGKLSGRKIVSNLGAGKSVLVEGMADAVFYPSGMPVTVKGVNPSGNPKEPGHGVPNGPGSPSLAPTSGLNSSGRDMSHGGTSPPSSAPDSNAPPGSTTGKMGGL